MKHLEDSSDEERANTPVENAYDSDDEERSGPPGGHDILLDLMMPMFSGTKDSFGREVVPALPLYFDRVSEGRAPVSASKLLTLPLHVLALVVQTVPKASLAALALVNSDCRQLARSRQFTSILLDYSDQTLEIIGKLQEEAAERSNNGGLTRKPALGPCIRRLTVATHPGLGQLPS